MATNNQRWTAICDGLVNRTATDQEKEDLGAALYADPAGWAALTNGDKLAAAIKKMRQLCNHAIKQYKDELARNALVPANPDQLPEA